MVNKRNKTHRRNKTNKKNRKNSRRVSKKMYGGSTPPIDEVSNNTGLINASADYQQGKNQISNMYNKTLNLAEQPQTSLNLQAENANNFFNSSGIGSVENAVGTTVSNGVGSLAEKLESKIPGLQSDLTSGITDTSKKVSDLKNMLSSQQGQELLSNAGEVVKQVFEKVVEPVGEEALAEGNKLFKDEGKILANEINEIATVFPPVLFAEELANVGAAIGKGVTSGLHMFSNVANLKPKIDEAKAQFGDIKDKFGNLMANASAQAIDTQNSLNNVTQIGDIQQTGNNLKEPRYGRPELSNGSNGGSLKKIRRQSKMIGGRCRKAQDEFLHPQLVLSQLINKHKRRSRRNKR